MSLSKEIRRRRRRRKFVQAAPALGAAGLSLALANGAAAAVDPPTAVEPTAPAPGEITLSDEEISDVSLATFYVFEKENAASARPRTRLAMGAGCGCGCGGCGCWTGTYYAPPIFGDGYYPPPPPHPVRPGRGYARTKRSGNQ